MMIFGGMSFVKDIIAKKRLIFVTAFLLGILVIPSIAVSSYNEIPKTQKVHSLILEKAMSFVDLPSDASLEYLGLIYDEFWQKELWSVRWMTENHNLVEVQFEKESLELVFFVNTPEPVMWKLIDKSTARKRAWSTIMGFITNLESKELAAQIDNAHISALKRISDGWMLEWGHKVNGVSVMYDFIRVSTNAYGSRVQAYTKCWYPVSIDTKPEIDSGQAVRLFKSLVSKAQLVTLSVELGIVRYFGNHYLAWIVDSGSQEIWVDAKQGYLISYDVMLSDDYQDCYALDLYWDSGWRQNEETYECVQDIQRRLRSGTSYPSGYTPRFFQDKSLSFVLGELEDEKVYLHMGHGHPYEQNGNYYTAIQTYTDDLTPSSISSKYLYGMYLAFLMSCWSAADDWDGHDIDKSIAQKFVDRGAKCAVGWDLPVEKSEAQKFSRYFFNLAVQGYTFSSCFNSAKSKVNSSTQSIARILGTTSYYLNDDDDPGESYPTSQYLGKSSQIVWEVEDEGVWGSDVDYFKFEADGTCNIEILVDPRWGLDARLRIYNSAYLLVAYRNNAGVNGDESYSFTGSGIYYIKVYHSQSGNPHGGAYDLTVDISS